MADNINVTSEKYMAYIALEEDLNKALAEIVDKNSDCSRNKESLDLIEYIKILEQRVKVADERAQKDADTITALQVDLNLEKATSSSLSESLREQCIKTKNVEEELESVKRENVNQFVEKMILEQRLKLEIEERGKECSELKEKLLAEQMRNIAAAKDVKNIAQRLDESRQLEKDLMDKLSKNERLRIKEEERLKNIIYNMNNAAQKWEDKEKEYERNRNKDFLYMIDSLSELRVITKSKFTLCGRLGFRPRKVIIDDIIERLRSRVKVTYTYEQGRSGGDAPASCE